MLLFNCLHDGLSCRHVYLFLRVTLFMSKYLCGSLSVCMFVCMYVCMYVRMYVCTYVCTHVRMYVCLSVCMCVCLSVCLSVAEEQRGDCININVESADSEYSTLYLSPF